MKEEFNEKWVKPKTWDEFRKTGLFMFVNTMLHAFGWALVVEVENPEKENEKVIKSFPARVRYRGFGEIDQAEMHERIANHLAEQAPNFPEEIS